MLNRIIGFIKRAFFRIRGKKVKSFYKDALALYETKTGKYYLPVDAPEDIVARAIRNNDIFDSQIFEWGKKFISPGTVVLDIGANYGQMSILFSKCVGKDGEIYSFEANSFIYEILCKNVNANSSSNISPIFGAVHNVSDQKLIFPEPDFNKFKTYGSFGIDYNKQKQGNEVNSLTIDSLEITEKISLMKIDIQGGDLYAMQGAKTTIDRNRMPIIFEFEYLFQDDMHLDFQEYVDFVQSINYRFARVIDGQNYLILPRENSHYDL